MRIRPRAVILDYGNVLCRPQDAGEIAAMAALLKLPGTRFEEIYWRHRLAYDEAKLEPAEYWKKFGPVGSAEIEELTRLDSTSWTRASDGIVSWTRELRQAGFRIALLSNMPFRVRDAVLACDWLPSFDQCTFSCELGVSKPSPEIYRYCLRGLGVAAGDALFLDDRPDNVRGAEAIGMHGIVFTTADTLASELAARFDIPPPGIATLKKGNEKDQ